MKHAGRLKLFKKKVKYWPGGKYPRGTSKPGEAEANIKALSYRSELDKDRSEERVIELEKKLSELNARRKAMYDKYEVDLKDTHSRYTALSGKYGSWDLLVDARYKTVLKNIAAAREGLSHETDAAVEIWFAAMDASLGKCASSWRVGE